MSTVQTSPHSEIPAVPPHGFQRLLPGMVLVAIVTAAAYGLSRIPELSGFSPMISAIFIGMMFANFTSVPQQALPGVDLAGKKLLRLAVALLGLQLTIGQIFEVGTVGMLALAALVFATYGFMVAVGMLLSVEVKLARLLAAGTAICGASAVAAASAVDNATDEDIAYAVATVTLFGTVAMLLYPLVGAFMQLDARGYGFWVGSSIHEVAQVVAAGFQPGPEAGEYSVLVKLSRVLLLAPLLLAVSLLIPRNTTSSGATLSANQIMPLFVAGFIMAVLANTYNLVPTVLRDWLVQLTPIMLTAALGALGLGTHFSALHAKGLRPLLVALLGFLFIAGGSLVLLPLIA